MAKTEVHAFNKDGDQYTLFFSLELKIWELNKNGKPYASIPTEAKTLGGALDEVLTQIELSSKLP